MERVCAMTVLDKVTHSNDKTKSSHDVIS